MKNPNRANFYFLMFPDPDFNRSDAAAYGAKKCIVHTRKFIQNLNYRLSLKIPN